MFYYDRMYGELRFPPLVRDVLDCPGLLRLREVRMANIPFLSFPSFTGVTRYEHSLGVCHLAGLFARAAALSEKDKTEIMLAALYHDAATPPFGHAVEEVLSELHGYDHEEKLREIILGKGKDPGGQRTQLFLGRSLKVHKVCQSRKGRTLGLDVLRIADLAAGTTKDPMGDVICSSGIDLDNVDNVIRAATAMGIREYGPEVAVKLACSFHYDGERVCIDETALPSLEAWKRARSTLYGMIYASLVDFSLQTMLKHALRKLEAAPTTDRLRETDWCLTDDELIHRRLLRCEATADIVTKMRLGELYTCLAYVLVEPKSRQNDLAVLLKEAEAHASTVFQDYLDDTYHKKKGAFELQEIIVNVYPEKRVRSAGRPTCFMGKQTPPDMDTPSERWLMGVFTPYHRGWDKKAEEAFCSRLASSYDVKPLRRVRTGEGRYPNVEEVKDDVSFPNTGIGNGGLELL